MTQNTPAVLGPVESSVGRPVEQRAEDGAPTVAAARRMGEKGSEVVEGERLAFEAWMAGHCWPLCARWTGTHYRGESESINRCDPDAMMTRRLWAAWRDRAALARDMTPNV
jgi:hypothetical protein